MTEEKKPTARELRRKKGSRKTRKGDRNKEFKAARRRSGA